MAIGSVVAQREVTLALVPVADRAVELRVTRNGAPVAKASCALDVAPGSTLSSNRVYLTGDDGTTQARAPKLPARLRCAAPGAPFAPARTIAPDETRVTVEVP